MIFLRNFCNVPDLAGQVESGLAGWDPGPLSVTVVEQYMSGAGVQSAELRQEAEFISSEHQVGRSVMVKVHAMDGADGGELYHGGEFPDGKFSRSVVDGNDGGGIIELSHEGVIEQGGGE